MVKVNNISENYNYHDKEYFQVIPESRHKPIYAKGYNIDQRDKHRNLVLKAVLGCH